MRIPFKDRLDTVWALARSGLVRPERPDRAVRAAQALIRWGPTPAAGCAANAIRTPSAPAVIDEDGRLSWRRLHLRTNAIAHALADRGVLEGDGVAVVARNHRGFVEAVLAGSKLGANVLLMNTSFSAPQAQKVLQREKPRAVIYDAEFAGLVGQATEGRRAKRFLAYAEAPPGADEDDDEDKAKAKEEARDAAIEAIEREETLEALAKEGDPHDPVAPTNPGKLVILTSGTTGTPKGANRSSPSSVEPIAAIFDRVPMRAGEATLIAPPLFHAWGVAHVQFALALGSAMILQRKFDPEATLAAIDEHRPTVLAVVPVMLKRMLDLEPEVRDQYDTSSLRVVIASGSALAADLANRFMNAYGDVLYNLYGSTEIAWAAIATPEDLRDSPGTVGRAPLGTELEILDEDDNELPTGETGRIFVGNDLLFEGYTSGEGEEMVDGMMFAGDLGHLDENGRLFIDGREDDMIVSGGENVYPAEVEELISGLDGVGDVAVVGVEDEEFGERLKAVIVKSGNGVSEKKVKDHVKQNAARYKVPRDVEFVGELPRNAAGKVDKKSLGDSDDD